VACVQWGALKKPKKKFKKVPTYKVTGGVGDGVKVGRWTPRGRKHERKGGDNQVGEEKEAQKRESARGRWVKPFQNKRPT